MKQAYYALCTLWFTVFPRSAIASSLSQFKNYEIVELGISYEDDYSNRSSLSSISFKAFETNFEIRLRPQESLLHTGFQSLLVHQNGSHSLGDLSPASFFEGIVEGIPDSSVRVTQLTPHSLVIVVSVNSKIFYVDPLSFYEECEHGMHVVYRAEDVRVPRTAMDSPFPGRSYRRSFSSLVRRPRDAHMSPVKNRCPLKIVADHFFFNTVGHRSHSISSRYIAGLIDRVNMIFTSTDWGVDDNGIHLVNLGFSIKKIILHEAPNPLINHYNSNSSFFYQYNQPIKWTVTELLNAFTQAEGSSEYCLSVFISGRIIENDVVRGLAYVGTSDMPGGICGKEMRRNSFASEEVVFNTLIAVVVDNASPHSSSRLMSTRGADLVLAHELGHSWGANHDPNVDECLPTFAHGGLYIMYNFTLAGYDPNNNKFSPCSKTEVRNTLSSRRERCFEMEKTYQCGNGVVEEGEECDDGGFHTPCCTPECRFTSKKAVCTPTNSPCCSQTCSFMNASHVCAQSNPYACASHSTCSGHSGACPPPRPIRDGADCAEGGECRNGTCVPFCERRSVGKLACICEEVALACKRCCRDPKTLKCEPEKGAGDLPDGTTCMQGKCVNSTCFMEKPDVIRHYFSVLSRFDPPLIKKNLVLFIVIIVTVIFLMPLFCCTRIYKYVVERQSASSGIPIQRTTGTKSIYG